LSASIEQFIARWQGREGGAERANYALLRREEVRARAIAIALAAASGPVSAADIAARFRQGRRVERDIALTLKAYVRYGDVTTRDGGRTFELRRAA
jgi:hypothetical protein